VPLDARASLTQYYMYDAMHIGPTVTNYMFNLAKREAPYCYLIGKTLISATFTIRTADNNALPAPAFNVAGCNNMLHSLFSSVEIKINNHLVNSDSSLYYYKAYLRTLLTYPGDSKNSWLQSSGFYKDVGDFDSPDNTGLILRSERLRLGHTVTGEYIPEGCQVMGELMHDFHGVEKPLPPWAKVDITLTKNLDDIFIQSNKSGGQRYKFDITSVKLYVPVLSLSQELQNQLYAKIIKNPILYNYRFWKVSRLPIPDDIQTFSPTNLYNESQNPVRVFLCIVQSTSYDGDQATSPYYFARKWLRSPPPAPPNQLQQQKQPVFTGIDLTNEVQKALANILKNLPSNPGEPIASGSSNNEQQTARSGVMGYIKTMLNSEVNAADDDDAHAAASSAAAAGRNAAFADPVPPDPKTAVEYHLERMQLKINGNSVDQLQSVQTRDSCNADFVRTFLTNQQFGTLFSSSISLHEYESGFHIVGYDLSSSLDGGCDAFVSPRVRIGK